MNYKAQSDDFVGRWREIISDPLNILIERHPNSGLCDKDGYVCLHNGNKVSLVGENSYYEDFSKVLVLNRGVHEPLEEFCFQEMLKKVTAQNPVMIELGSYWAHYSMWFKKKFPDAQCFMVEESSKGLNAGRHNFSVNNHSNGDFILSKVGNNAFTIDDFTKEKRLEEISVLHSDIQGWELEMIDGATDFLGKHAASYIFLSTHSQKIHKEAKQKLVSFGYVIEVSSDFDNHTTSYDGFILATAPQAERVFQNFQPFGRSEISAHDSSSKLEYLYKFNDFKLKKPQNINLTFGDGTVSKIDEDVQKLILSFQKELKSTKSKLPFLWDLSQAIKGYSEDVLDFYSHTLKYRNISTSQLFQDLFVLFILNDKNNGTFLEFGATNGSELSNSFMLENSFGWTGVLAEPSPQWHSDLFNNRPNTTILTECIYSETGKKMDFFVSEKGVFSTLEEFKDSDIHSMPGNTKLRNASGYTCSVDTVSLNDVILKHFNGEKIDYMSVDTEGSELLILQNFDFSKYAPKVVTVEHNFTDSQKALDKLFMENNYQRYFKDFTQFDAWYVRQD
jgi:FkbM family methyltransferase